MAPLRRRSFALAAVGLLVVLALAALALWRLPELYALRWSLEAGRPGMAEGPQTLVAPLAWADDYYAVADLGAGDFAIAEPRYGQCNVSYLLAGTERALLFDSGPGIRDLRPLARKLTRLPILALPSHLHFDHVGNLGRFDAVLLPDLPALRTQAQDGEIRLGREQFLGFVEGFPRPAFRVTRWVSPGAEIDLGGRRVTMLSVPGHTPDSVVILDRSRNHLYAGDFIYPSSIYAQLPGADLATYAASARRLLEVLDPSTAVYGAHGCDKLPLVDLPVLGRGDLADLARALEQADRGGYGAWSGYPRRIPVNARMELLAKYPWMHP
ncbi:MAG: MBL fold metallo-hydrolase [Proteobacteria bacterium]|nr:MBL fold metallo-hydrolase [Pseudomonadota bacterium]